MRKRILEKHGRHFSGMYLDNVRALEDAVKLIERVHTNKRTVALASLAKQDELEHHFALLGVKYLIAATTSIADVETFKPEPDTFGVAPDKVGVEASKAPIGGRYVGQMSARQP